MATKTITLELDASELLENEKQSELESVSMVIRRLVTRLPSLTAAKLEESMQRFNGKRAGRRRSLAR